MNVRVQNGGKQRWRRFVGEYRHQRARSQPSVRERVSNVRQKLRKEVVNVEPRRGAPRVSSVTRGTPRNMWEGQFGQYEISEAAEGQRVEAPYREAR